MIPIKLIRIWVPDKIKRIQILIKLIGSGSQSKSKGSGTLQKCPSFKAQVITWIHLQSADISSLLLIFLCKKMKNIKNTEKNNLIEKISTLASGIGVWIRRYPVFLTYFESG